MHVGAGLSRLLMSDKINREPAPTDFFQNFTGQSRFSYFFTSIDAGYRVPKHLQIPRTLSLTAFHLMDTTGLEPVTPTMSTWCSNQLSYASSQVTNIA